MVTREEILSIDRYCAEHKITHDAYFEAHSEIPRWAYYRYKNRYRKEDEQSLAPTGFVQLTPGGEFVSGAMSPARSGAKSKASAQGCQQESYLTIELRTSSGTAMRIQGSMTASHLHEIISASNV